MNRGNSSCRGREGGREGGVACELELTIQFSGVTYPSPSSLPPSHPTLGLSSAFILNHQKRSGGAYRKRGSRGTKRRGTKARTAMVR